MDIKPDDVVRVRLTASGKPLSNIIGAIEASQADFTVIAIDQFDPPQEVCILMDPPTGFFNISHETIKSLRGMYRASSTIEQYKDTGKQGRWISVREAVVSVVGTHKATEPRKAVKDDYARCVACGEPTFMAAQGFTCYSCRSNPARRYY